MRSSKDKFEALLRILRRAYREREKAEIGEEWRGEAMRRIGRLGPLSHGQDFFLLFEQFIWRLTPATCLLIVVLSVLLFKVGFSPDYDAFNLFMTNPGELTLAQLLGFKV